MKLRTGILALILATGFPLLAQQDIVISEDDVDMTVLTWHYRKYENAQSTSWTVKAQDGEALYLVDFTFQEELYSSVYDEKGMILRETKTIAEERMPDPITKVLDYRVVKYKVSSFTRVSLFENRNPSRIDYRVDVRTKTGGQIIFWFDQDFNLLPENRDDIAIK